jgi:endo-1,4-beta-xylanase
MMFRSLLHGAYAASIVFVPCWTLGADGPPPIPDETAIETAHPPAVPLWEEGAPGSVQRRHEAERVDWRQEPDIVFPVTSNIHQPSLVPYLPPRERATGIAVIIAPGGGHMFLTMDREGYDLARWLADRGVAAFVLKYRLARDRSTPEGQHQPYQVATHALADAQRAVRLIRHRAAEWGVRPDQVGFIGFSAGGEVAFLAATRSGAGQPDATDPVDRLGSRPDFQALVYPGLPRGDNRPLPADTPPTFLLSAFDDARPTQQLATLLTQLRAAGIPTEVHIYQRGGHGFGVRDRPLPVSRWPDHFLAWLHDLAALPRP